MKLNLFKGIAVAIFFTVTSIACAMAQTKTYQISGNIKGLSDQKVYLTGSYQGQEFKDSVVAKMGSFVFKGTMPGMQVYYLSFGKSGFLGLPVDVNEKIVISGSLDSIGKADIKGAKQLPIWKEWFRGWAAITARAGVLYKQLDSIEKAAGKDGDRSAVNAEFEKLNQRLVDSVEMLVRKYPSSPLVPYIIIDRFVNYPNPEKAASTYAALSSEAKNSPYGRSLGEAIRISGKTGIGVRPAFTIPDRDGKPLSLASLKGKVVLVDFWASWCGPCRKENPNLVKAYGKYHDQGFEIMGISLDDKKDNWLKAINADQLNWLHGSDLKGWKSDLAQEYGIKSIPMNFLVDADGKIIAKDLRGDALEKKLATLFN